MRKNNMLNKQVIKAMSIAISAGMLLQPMQALAESAPVDDRPDDQTKQFDDASNLAANTIKVDEKDVLQTDGYIEKAIDSADAVATAILPDGDDDPNKAIKDQANKKVVDKADELATFTGGADGQKLANDSEDTDAKVRQSASDEIAEMDNADIIIAGSIATGNKKAAEANAADKQQKDDQKDAETLAQNTTKAVSDAQKVVTEQGSALSNARDESEAVSVYNAAAEAVGSADAAVNAAETKFDEIEKDFKQAETNYNNAKQAADAAQGELNTARENFKNAKQAAINLTGGDDDESLDGDAEIKLAELEEKVQNLSAAADAAKKEYEEKGYGYIAKVEKEINDKIDAGQTPAWSEYRKFVEGVMKFHVLEEGQTFKSLKWQTNWKEQYKDIDTYGNGESVVRTSKGDPGELGEVLNYGLLTYTEKDENGNNVTKTMRINYKTVDGNDRKEKGIVIFEMTEHTVIDGKDLSKDVLENLDKADVGEAVVDEANNRIIYKNADGTYSGFDNTAANRTLDTKVTEDADASDGETVHISDDAEITYTVEDGKLIKTVKAEVTTTKYTQNNLATAEATLASEQAAKDQYVLDIKTKVGALADGAVLKVYGEDGTTVVATYTKADLTKENINWEAGFKVTTDEETTPVPTVTGYTVNGTYQKQFQKTISINDEVWGLRVYELFTGWHGGVDADDARSAYQSDINDAKDDYTFDNDGLSRQTDYNLISETHSDVTLGRHYQTAWGTIDHYNYSGSITVTYNEVKSETIPYSEILDALKTVGINLKTVDDVIEFFGNESNLAQYNSVFESINEKYAAEGKTVLSKKWFDGGVFKGTVYYIPAEQTSITYTGTDVEAAKQAFLAEYAGQGAMVTGTTEIVENVNQVITKYGYAGVKALVELASTENVVISTETWAKALGTAYAEYRNDNWYSGNVILAEYANYGEDVDYTNDGWNNATADKALGNSYEQNTRAFREKVDNAAAVAQMYVDTMNAADTALTDIKNAKVKIADLTASIKALKATEGSIDQINELSASLAKARAELDAAIRNRNNLRNELTRLDNELQRKLEDFRPVENPENNEQPAGPAAPAPAIRTVANAPAPAAAPEVEIEEENAPLAENPGEVEIVEEEAPKAPEVTVTEEATPTSPVPETETEKPSWLWLVIILALGTTGAELYRRHLLKQKALKAETEQKNNINK